MASVDAALAAVSAEVRTELAQLSRRYGSRFTLYLSGSADAKVTTTKNWEPPEGEVLFGRILHFTTTDPDFEKRTLPEGVTLGLGFGSSLAETRIQIIGDSLPENLQQQVNTELLSYCTQVGGKARSVLKWLDRRIGEERRVVGTSQDLHSQRKQAQEKRSADAWTLNQQRALEAALAKFPATLDQTTRWKSIARHVPGKSLKQCVQRFNHVRQEIIMAKKKEEAERQRRIEEAQQQRVVVEARAAQLSLNDESEAAAEEEEEEEDGDGLGLGRVAQALPKAFDLAKFQGTKVVVDGLQTSNVGYLYTTKTFAQSQCEKCGKVDDVELCKELRGSSSMREWCKCGLLHSFTFHPLLMHESNADILAAVEEQGAFIKDVISLDLIVACLECGSQIPFERIVRARPKQSNCPVCNVRLHVLCDQLTVTNTNERKPKKADVRYKARAQRDPRIVPGKPLPNNGACKHYRKSYRWLRFPCCNKAYPCPVCHELGSGCSDPKWATRQVCGFCAHEQRFTADKPCAKCGKVIGVKKSSAFWEGGKGCRDQKKMSSKDSRKYTNSNQKTRSNKSNRVGKAGKERATQRAS